MQVVNRLFGDSLEIHIHIRYFKSDCLNHGYCMLREVLQYRWCCSLSDVVQTNSRGHLRVISLMAWRPSTSKGWCMET